MKKLYLALLITFCLIGFVIAGDLITSQFTKDVPMDKAMRDVLLTNVAVKTDSKGVELPKEIKPIITIECDNTQCKWDAVQEGIISSYDNVINRMYCVNYKDNICIEEAQYPIKDIQDQVANKVYERLREYSTAVMNKDSKPISEVSIGTITISEKR